MTLTTTRTNTDEHRRTRTLLEWIGAPQIAGEVARLLEVMAPDQVNKPKVLAYLKRAEDLGLRAVELRTVVRALARAIKPRTYLEIGVRLGWSMAQVAAEAPECAITGCDPWIMDYGGVPNWGAPWVRAELGRVVPGFHGRLHFITGTSRERLPVSVDGQTFDMITVDGDHSGAGALWDLLFCLPRLNVGGALVFDDLVAKADAPGITLCEAWEAAKGGMPAGQYEWHEYDGLVPVGVAVRLA